jgi:hypothetical protein
MGPPPLAYGYPNMCLELLCDSRSSNPSVYVKSSSHRQLKSVLGHVTLISSILFYGGAHGETTQRHGPGAERKGVSQTATNSLDFKIQPGEGAMN